MNKATGVLYMRKLACNFVFILINFIVFNKVYTNFYKNLLFLFIQNKIRHFNTITQLQVQK